MIPNLDMMSPVDLDTFHGKYQTGGSERALRQLFGHTAPGTATEAGHLARYAALKASSIRLRKEGDVEAARGLEARCEGIYFQLPNRAQF